MKTSSTKGKKHIKELASRLVDTSLEQNEPAALDRESLHRARWLLRTAVGDLTLWSVMVEDGSDVSAADLRRVSERVARALWAVENVSFSAGLANVIPIRRAKGGAA